MQLRLSHNILASIKQHRRFTRILIANVNKMKSNTKCLEIHGMRYGTALAEISQVHG